MASKHGVHRARTIGWHPRSAVLLAWLEEEIKRRRDEGSKAPQGDLLEEGMEAYRVHGASSADGGPVVLWRPPAGGKLLARLDAHAERTGWPRNGLITEAVHRFLDQEAPQGDGQRPRPQPVPDQNTKGES